MKTVFHWKNIGKALIALIIYCFIMMIFMTYSTLPKDINFIINLGCGIYVGWKSNDWFNLYHFESDYENKS